MKINSPSSIRSANTVVQRYGSWTAARAAATPSADGTLRIPRNPPTAPGSARERPPRG